MCDLRATCCRAAFWRSGQLRGDLLARRRHVGERRARRAGPGIDQHVARVDHRAAQVVGLLQLGRSRRRSGARSCSASRRGAPRASSSAAARRRLRRRACRAVVRSSIAWRNGSTRSTGSSSWCGPFGGVVMRLKAGFSANMSSRVMPASVRRLAEVDLPARIDDAEVRLVRDRRELQAVGCGVAHDAADGEQLRHVVAGLGRRSRLKKSVGRPAAALRCDRGAHRALAAVVGGDREVPVAIEVAVQVLQVVERRLRGRDARRDARRSTSSASRP